MPDAREVADDALPDLYDLGGPSLRGGLIASLDGVAAVDGSSRPLSGPDDRAVLRALRTVADAVVVGAGTARAESYGPVRHAGPARAWRQAHGRSPQAALVVVTRTGRLPESALTGPLLVVAPGRAELPATGEHVEVIRTGGDEVDLADAVAQLHARGLPRLLCEGGPALLRDLLAAELVDELCLTAAPSLVGTGPRLVDGLVAPVDLQLVTLLHAPPGPLLGRWRVVRSAGA